MMMTTGWVKDSVEALLPGTAHALMRSGRILPVVMFLDDDDKECPLARATGCAVATPRFAFYATLGSPETVH